MASTYGTRGGTVQIEGLTEFLTALRKADRATKKAVRNRLREAGQFVRDDAESLFSGYSPKSAGGYRVVVRARAIEVDQKYGKSKNVSLNRPHYAGLQMRKALDPAELKNRMRTMEKMEEALLDLKRIIEGGSKT